MFFLLPAAKMGFRALRNFQRAQQGTDAAYVPEPNVNAEGDPLKLYYQVLVNGVPSRYTRSCDLALAYAKRELKYGNTVTIESHEVYKPSSMTGKPLLSNDEEYIFSK